LNYYLEGFKKKYDPQGLNTVKLDGAKLTMEEFRKAASQIGFLAKKRFMVVQNLMRDNKKIESEITEYLQKEWVDDNVLIFLEQSESRTSSKKKGSKTTGHPLLNFLMDKKSEEFSTLAGENLNKWIRAEVKNRGGSIDGPAVLELASLVGSDLWNMSGEIEKLINYRSGQTITNADVKLLVKAKFDENIFHLNDALAARDARQTFKLLSDQINAGAHELYILTMLIRQFRILLQVREILGKEPNYHTIASRLRLHPFVAQKAIRDARRFSVEELKKIYRRLLEIDTKIKSSNEEPRVFFDLFITEVCRG
jgi:DNA polymerase-3 subunit delta